MKANLYAKRLVSRAALLLEAAALCVCSTSAMAAVIDGTLTNVAIPNNIDGIYINLVAGTTGAPTAPAGWDINPYGATNALQIFWPSTPTTSSGGVATASPTGVLTPLAPGATVSSSSLFATNVAATVGSGFQGTQDAYLGFRFFNEATGAINYGYARFTTTAPSGFPATLVCYRYENTGAAITVAACGAVANTAPTLTYSPTTAAGVTFPAGAAGSVNATIAISSSGAVGTGQSAVTSCAVSGVDAGSFGAVTTTPAGGIFNTGTTSGSINLSCTRGASVANATLACSETATPTVAGSPFLRTWNLTCPAATVVNVAPVAAVAPTTLTGGSGSVTPTITTPAQGTGSTVFGCSIPATAPSNFAITSNATQTLTTGAPLAIGLSCVPQAAATTATLTCTQIATPGPNPANATATITCPAAPAAAPTLTYTPSTAAGVTFPSGAAGTVNSSIAISSAGAVGVGQSAVTGCAISGPGSAAFGAVTTTPAGGIFNTGTTSGSINLSCTRGASVATATLTCTETATPTVAGSPFSRTWNLTCPAATVVDVAPVAAVAPTTLTGGSGSVTPTITTPAQGTGSTTFGCSIPATAPSNFAITSNATQTLTTGAPLAIGLSCVPQAAATTATLTCTQAATPGPNPANATALITCPAAPAAAPTLTYTPSTAAGVTFPSGAAGSVNASIAISSAGAIGIGQSAVSGCAISGAGSAAFGAVSTTPAGGVFNTGTTSGSIDLSCTRGASASTATLTCTETATPTVAGSPFTRTWALTCPAVTPVAPVAAVAPTTLTGGSGSVTPTITTPAQGAGSTVFGCSIPATAPSNFAITGNATQTLTTGAPLAIGLSCVPQAAATTATLTCTQTATPGPNPADATAVITCPAAPAAAPTLTYTPSTAAGVTFASGGVGSANATIAISSAGAIGIGQSAVTGCAISGAGAAAFGAVSTTPAGGVFNTGTTSGSINLSCTRGASVATASLSCTETATPTVAGSPFTRTWALTCPAVIAVVNPGTASGTVVTLPPYTLPTGSATANLSFTSVGNASVLTCTATGAGFSVAPSPLNLAAGVAGSVTVTYTGSVVGTFTGSLNCTSSTTGGPFNYPLSVLVGPAIGVPVPALTPSGTWVLILGALGLGLLGVAGRRRD